MQRKFRLCNNASFSFIYKKGQSVACPLFKLYFVSAASVKVGIVVSKKVGKSVVRSLVKRRFRESFRLLIPLLKVKCNYVVLTRDSAALASYHQINNSLLTILKRINHIDA